MRDETQLIVKGVICRAPELKIMKTGKPFVVIDVAVNKLNKTTNEKYAEFVSVYVTDEWLIERAKTFSVGSRLYANGYPELGAWVKDGIQRKKLGCWSYEVYVVPKTFSDGAPDMGVEPVLEQRNPNAGPDDLPF